LVDVATDLLALRRKPWENLASILLKNFDIAHVRSLIFWKRASPTSRPSKAASLERDIDGVGHGWAQPVPPALTKGAGGRGLQARRLSTRRTMALGLKKTDVTIL
jgi:hypothetical protein